MDRTRVTNLCLRNPDEESMNIDANKMRDQWNASVPGNRVSSGESIMVGGGLNTKWSGDATFYDQFGRVAFKSENAPSRNEAICECYKQWKELKAK